MLPPLQMFLNSCEQICLLLDQSRSHPGHQMKHFLPTAPTHVGFEQRPQWRLARVSLERGDFSLQVIANFEDRGSGRQCDRLAIGQGKVYGSIVELLASVRLDCAR